jgi:hypothetical protein
MNTEAVSQIVDQIQGSSAPSTGEGALVPENKEPQVQDIKPDQKVTDKLQALIQRERLAVQKEKLARQKEAEVESKLARIQEFEERKARLREKPDRESILSTLGLLDLSPEHLTKSLMDNGELPPEVHIKRIEDKFEAFQSQQEEEAKKRADEAQKQAQEQESAAVDRFKGDINTYLTDNKDRYELIGFEGQQDLVYEVINEHYTRTLRAHMEELETIGEDTSKAVGKVLKISEAADKVEKYLEEKYEKSRDLNKVKTLWGAVPKEAIKNAVQEKAGQHKSQPPKTLTNNLSATPTAPRKTALSDEERVQRAIAYARSLRPGL